MKKEEKKVIIEEIKAKLQEVEKTSLLFVDFGRVKANEIAELRKDFRKSGINYRVVKADLLRIVFKELGYDSDSSLFRGSVAMAAFPGDATELARKFSEVKDEEGNPIFKFKGGFVEGKWYGADTIILLSKLPPKTVLIAQLLYLINLPLSRLATVLSKPQRDLVTVLNQIKDNKQHIAA